MLVLSTKQNNLILYDTDSKKSAVVTPEGLDPEKVYITYDLFFPNVDVYCLRLASKIVDPKFTCSLDTLAKRWLHKPVNYLSFKGVDEVCTEHEIIARIFFKVAKRINDLRLTTSFKYECKVGKMLSVINGQKVPIDRDKITKEYQLAKEGVSKIEMRFSSVVEFKQYLDFIGYDYWDVIYGSNIDPSILASVDDAGVQDYVKFHKCNGMANKLRQFFPRGSDVFLTDSMVVNYKNLGTPTGRLYTKEPNIQVLPARYIKGGYISIDYNAQTLYVYLALFKQELMKLFLASENEDMYCWVYNNVFVQEISDEEFKATRAKMRDCVKTTVSMLTNGATHEEVMGRIQKLGKPREMDYFADYVVAIDKFLEISVTTHYLLGRMITAGGILMDTYNGRIHYSDKVTEFIRLHNQCKGLLKYKESELIINQILLVRKYRSELFKVKRILLGYVLQSTAATAFKMVIMHIVHKFPGLMYYPVHDDILFSPEAVDSIDDIVEIMEGIPVKVIGYRMKVKVQNNTND